MKSTGLIFGCAYYPEYMPYERLAIDIEWMKEAGINTVRMAESTWSIWEPTEGAFDFSLLTRTLDAMQEAGINVIIGTPTYAIPAWLAKKDPTVMADTKSGRVPYGARQQMDILNPTYRFYAKRIIEKLLEVVQPYTCVIGYQLDNETKYYGCYSQFFQDGFVESLKNRFGTVEEMNKAFGLAHWSNSLGDWEDFPDVRGTINPSLAAAFDAYRRQVAADFLLWQREIIDPFLKEDQFVTQNLDFSWEPKPEVAPGGCSYGVQPGIYHYGASKALSLVGVDIYHPGQDALTGEEIAFGGDCMWSLKEDPYLVVETQAQAFPEWTPYPGQILLQAVSHLASGAMGMMYWHWASLHNGIETYWRGILGHDLNKNRVYWEVCKAGKLYKHLAPILQGFRRQAKVALLVDNASQDALTWFEMNGGTSYNDLVRTYHRVLYRRNVEVDVIDSRAFLERYGSGAEPVQEECEGVAKKNKGYAGTPYKVLVTPGLYCVSEELVTFLRKFVEEGGMLVSSCRSFVANQDLKIYAGRLPAGMTEVFGACYQEITRSGSTMTWDQPVEGFMELLMPAEDEYTQVLLKYDHPVWGEYAAVTSHCFGMGLGVYIGALLQEDVLGDVFETVLDEDVFDEDGPRFPVIVRRGIDDWGNEITFYLNYSGEEQRVVWKGWKSLEILSQKDVMPEDILVLNPWGFMVVES